MKGGSGPDLLVWPRKKYEKEQTYESFKKSMFLPDSHLLSGGEHTPGERVAGRHSAARDVHK